MFCINIKKVFLCSVTLNKGSERVRGRESEVLSKTYRVILVNVFEFVFKKRKVRLKLIELRQR